MPKPAKIMLLPEEIRRELDQRIQRNGFGGYQELSNWLSEQGYSIAKNTIWSYGKEQKEKLQAMQQTTQFAKAMQAELGDDSNALGDVATSLALAFVVEILSKLTADKVVDGLNVPAFLSSLANLQKSSVLGKKYAQEVILRSQEALSEVDKVQQQGGLSEDAAATIRAKILGIAGRVE